MKLVALSTQELAAHIYESEGTARKGGGLFFRPFSELYEVVSALLPYGKLLLVGDEAGFLRLGKLVRTALSSYRLLSMAELDLSALFAFDDEIGGVVGLGSRSFAAVRYFAAVRSLPCVCLADTPSCESLISPTVPVGKGEYPVPLPDAIVVDEGNLFELASSYARIASSAVRLIDCTVREVFLKESYSSELYALADGVADLKWYDPQFPLRLWEGEFRLAYCTRAGLAAGNESYLLQALGGPYELAVLEKLVKLYRLFLTEGYCRPYASADYVKRLRLAGKGSAGALRVPNRALLRRRAAVLQLKRHALLISVSSLYCRLPVIVKTYLMLGGKLEKPEQKKLKQAIAVLPESNPSFTLFTLMRDFGLLEQPRRFRRVKKSA